MTLHTYATRPSLMLMPRTPLAPGFLLLLHLVADDVVLSLHVVKLVPLLVRVRRLPCLRSPSPHKYSVIFYRFLLLRRDREDLSLVVLLCPAK